MIQTFTIDLGMAFDDLNTLLCDRENDLGTLVQCVKEPVNGTLLNAALFDSATPPATQLILKQFPAISVNDELGLANQLLTLQQQQNLNLISYAIASIGNQDVWLAILRALAPGQTPPGPGVGGNNVTATEFGGGSDFPMASAYGGTVDPNSPQVALPAHLSAISRKIQVKLSGNPGPWIACAVNDVGPWNVNDPYWSTGGRPAAESEHASGTLAQNNKVPSNPAGIDLTPAVMNSLGISGSINARSTTVDWQFV